MGHHLRLLGAFEVRLDESAVSLAGARPRDLVTYLALHHEIEVPRHLLANLFWPESSEAQSRTNLRNLLHRIKRATPNGLLDVDEDHVRLASDIRIDVVELRRIATDVADGLDAEEELAALELADSLFQGELAPGCRAEWIFEQREDLRRLAAELADDYADALEQRGDLRAALRVSLKARAHDPGNELAHRRVIRLLVETGDRAGAQRAWHACVEALAELDLAPGESTAALVANLRSPASRAEPQQASAPFVGRAAVLETLVGQLEVLGPDQASVVCIRGEAGVGKTRLADELLRLARRRGMTVGTARCYAAAGTNAYRPVATWLRTLLPRLAELPEHDAIEVARLVPEIRPQRPDLPAAGAMEHPWQREHFLEALARATRPDHDTRVLLLDDVQWCDQASVEWLGRLLLRDAGGALLLMLTERSGEPGTESLREFERTMIREGVWTTIELDPLSLADAGELVTRLAGNGTPPAELTRVVRESEGNPLFLVELSRAERITGGSPLPEKLAAVIEGRLATLSNTAREMARVAALIGREIDWELLLAVSGLELDFATDAFDELWRRGIVREHAGLYDFAHAKIRDVAAAELSPIRRRVLHQRIAETLSSESSPEWARVATHFEEGGDAFRAANGYYEAGRMAAAVFANQDAVVHLERALHLLEIHEVDRRVEAAVLLAEVLHRMGRTAEARAKIDAVLDGPNPTKLDAARLHRRLAAVWTAQNEREYVLGALEEAERQLEQAPASPERDSEQIEVRLDRMMAHYWLGQWEAMEQLVGEVEGAIATATPRQRAYFHVAATGLVLRRDRYTGSEEQARHIETAVNAADLANDPNLRAEARFLFAFCLLQRGELAAARQPLEETVREASRTGHRWLELRGRTYLAFHSRRTRADDIVALAERCIELGDALDMATYAAVARAHLSCVALRRGDEAQARELVTGAIRVWDDSVGSYPFQWCGLLVELAVMDWSPRAKAVAATLQKPMQQRLPTPMPRLLGELANASEAEGPACLAGVVSAARELALI